MKQTGFSLIEIMISSFILAIGILGLAGMQTLAVKSVDEVQQRTLANSLLVDITERMQLNHVWLENAANNYNTASLIGDASIAAPTCVTNGGFSNCTGAQIKDNDLFEWREKLKFAHVKDNSGTGLANPDACIATTANPSGSGVIVTVVLSWFSTLSSVDAAKGKDAIFVNCGSLSDNRNRRQVSVQSFISQP